MPTFKTSGVGFIPATDENAAVGGMGPSGKAPKRSALGEISNNTKKNRVIKPSKAVQPVERSQDAMEVDGQFSQASFAPELNAVGGLPAGVDDIDAADQDDPQLVAAYVDEIMAYQKVLERKQSVVSQYMKGVQADVTPNMRTILVDWLVEVHIRFQLQQETLYMTFHILDRFLSIQQISRSKLQLAGVTAMLVASKYEEMYPPEVRDFVWIADNAYTREQIIAMEGLMLKTLDFNLGCPLPLHFLRRFSKATSADQTTHHLSKYLMELSISSYNMCGFLPSEIATAAIYLAHTIMAPGASAWTKNLEHYSGYTFADVNRCVKEMTRVIVKSVSIKQQAVRRKYASKKLLRISELSELSAFIAENSL